MKADTEKLIKKIEEDQERNVYDLSKLIRLFDSDSDAFLQLCKTNKMALLLKETLITDEKKEK